MNAWETEDEYAVAAQRPRPTPVDAPSRNSSRHSRRSRRSSRKKSVSPVMASSPGPMPNGEIHSRRDSNITADENISILDPRRFTPTLHANLVAEILNLRRDQEEKMRAIESLEGSLHATKGEVEELTSTLSSHTKENRSIKRQLALLEGGTSSALGELARERDEAVEGAAEIKRRLDVAQKKVRSQEEDADRVHGLWARDKDAWEDERRKLERKAHVAEGRLKIVLEEVAAYQASQQVNEFEADELSKDVGGQESDTASIRSMSMTNSVRFSLLPNGSKLNDLSLADELDLEEDDDELPQLYQDGRDSVLSTTHRRNHSRDSMVSRTHKHTQSIESVRRPASVARGRLLANQSVLEKLEGRIAEGDETLGSHKPTYVDSGVQYSPPLSPVPDADVGSDPTGDAFTKQADNNQGGETEANQRRKRVRASTPIPKLPPNTTDSMVSSGCQTVDEPLSPPHTPKSSSTLALELGERCVTNTSTQTDAEWVPMNNAQPLQSPIPSISIHPPTSRPGTPKEPLLPQYFKDVACQVSMQIAVSYGSVSVQTEEIRVDKRLNLLPLHLHPSSISSCPPSPELAAQPSAYFTPGVEPPPRNPRRKTSHQSIADISSSPPVPFRSPPPPPMATETRDSYPGNNDDGPLSAEKGIFRRPPRISSLFAGFENVSSDDADDFADGDLSDSDFRTALSAPRPRKSLNKVGKRTATTPTSVPEDVEPAEEVTFTHYKRHLKQQGNSDALSQATLRESPNILDSKAPMKQSVRQFDKPLSIVMPPARQQTMRRAALISNGIAAHQGRSRSPSLPDAIKEPPFPIPTRASSRKPPFSASAPSDGSRSPTRDPWPRRGSGRRHHRANSIRKVRSAAALPEIGLRSRRRGSRSPPPFSPATEAPESPQLPPMPNNEITSPFMGHRDIQNTHRYTSHRKQQSNTTANTFNTNQSAGSSVQATSVVDAIAQTMVGEWMFKYVRRRKSFGVPESSAIDSDASNGVRHKRWVWLAPYERAVMWSSKQPTSGSALMGKSGRKLTIQSVLDVKDDNPAPKGVTNIFNRSILILTPARALKFTATTRERHYIWLTALSFLAHSSQTVPEVMATHPPPNELGNFDILRQNGARLQKQPIRDSIRIAKGRANLMTQSGSNTAQSSIYKGGEYSIRTDTSTRGGASTTGDHSVKDIGSHHGGIDGFIPEAADPPVVPRFTDRAFIGGGHGRKRSNTGSRIPPPLSFRGFSERGSVSTGSGSNNGGVGAGAFTNSSNYGHAPASSTAGMSVGTNGSSDIYTGSQRSSSVMGGNSSNFSNGLSNSNRTSIRTSDASSRPGAVVNNFFEAVGTVRMEAFISPLAFPRSDDYHVPIDDLGMGPMSRSGVNRRRSKERRRRSRNRDSYYWKHRAYPTDVDDWYGGSKTAGEEDYRREKLDDPFRGF